MDNSSASLTALLTDDEFEEYQKVFSIICSSKIPENDELNNIQHLNENSFFTCNNLTALVQNITKNFLITKQQVVSVMPLLDVNYSGIISWEAFIVAMNDWINRSQCFGGLFQKKIGLVLGARERQIFHYAIANFFLLSSHGISNTVDKLNSILELSGSKFDFQMIDILHKTKDEKGLPYKDQRELLKNFDSIVLEIEKATTIYQALEILNNVMSFISKAPSLIDLHVDSDLISNILNFFFENGLLDRVCVIVVKEENLHVKWEGLKTLSYILACFTLKNEKFNGPQYAQSDQVKTYLLNEEFLSSLLGLTFSSCVEVRDQGLLCVGFLVQINNVCRDYFVSQNIVANYFNCLVNENTDIHLEMMGFVLSSIASSVATNFQHLMDNTLLFGLVDSGYKLLNIRDVLGLLKSGFETLAAVLPLVSISPENKVLFERLMKILELHPSVLVKKLTLATIKEIAEKNESQTKALIDFKLLPILNDILSSNEHTLKLYCCRILHILAKKGYVLQLFDAKCLPIISKRFYDTPHCRWECLKILKAIVTHSQSYSSFLVENGVVKLIFNNLNTFREKDDTLAEVYGYDGFYMNLPFLIDCFTTLNTIIMYGYGTKGVNTLNVFIDSFDRENVEKLGQVLDGLFENKSELKSQINRTYNKLYTQNGFEQLLINFITEYRNMHKAQDSDNSKQIVFQLSSFLVTLSKKFQEFLGSDSNIDIMQGGPLEIRCMSAENYPNGDNRLITATRIINLSQLKSAVELKYNYVGPIMIQYFDKNQELLTIDEDTILQKAIAEVSENLLTFGTGVGVPILRVIIKFSEGKGQGNQPKEMQCFECGKKFEVLEWYEPLNPDELFICYECKQEQGQLAWGNTPMSMNPMFTKSPYPFPYK